MGSIQHILLGVFLSVAFIYLSLHIPEGIEDRSQLTSLAAVFKIVNAIHSVLYHLGVNDVFPVTRSLISMADAVPEGVSVKEAHFDGIRVKIVQPVEVTKGPLPAFIYIHGGGLVVGSPEEYNNLAGNLAKEVGMVVVAVSYRLAPEHLYPAQSDDVLKATEYFLQHCSEWGVDASKIFMGGDSAGGLLTAVTTIRLIRKNLPKPRAIVLIYPLLQVVSFSTPSYIQNADNFVLPRIALILMRLTYGFGRTQELMEAFKVNNFTSFARRKAIADKFNLPELANRGPPHFDQNGDPELITRLKDSSEEELTSPLLTSVIDRFPPTLFIVSEFDILRDDSVMMARRLREANVPVEYYNYYSFHGMVSFATEYKPTQVALRRIVEFVNKWKK